MLQTLMLLSAHLILPMAVLGPVQTTTALALPAVTTVPCHNNTPHEVLGFTF